MNKAPHPVDIYVGRKLRLRRTILDMSQETMGKSVGITFQQIQKYERGINRMGASRLYDFGRTLSVPIAYFFEGYGDHTQSDTDKLGTAELEAVCFEHVELDNREVRDMMRAYSRVKSPAVRKKILDLIKTFAEADAVGDVSMKAE